MPSSSSKKVIWIAIAIVIVIVIAIPVFLLTRRSRQPVDRTTRLVRMSMTSDLHGLIMAEQATKQLRGRYVSDPAEAGHLSSPGVTPPVITLSDTGWSAIVESKTISGLRCAVGVYNRNPIKRFAKSGEVVCEP